MLHVEQWTLRSRIEMTGAAGADGPVLGADPWAAVRGKGFAGSVIVRWRKRAGQN
jgi:hypothetical protein